LGYLALHALIWTLPFGLFPAFEQPSVSQRFYFQIAATTIALLYFGASWLEGRLRLPTNVVLWAAVLYVACVTASSLVARSAWFTIKESVFLWSGFLLFAVVVHLRLTQFRCRRLLTSLALIGGVCAAYGVLQYLGLDLRWGAIGYAPDIKEGRFHVLSLLGHPNYLTAYIGPALFLCPGLIATSSSHRIQIALGVTATVIALCIFLAGTRSAWLATLLLGGGLAAAFASQWRSIGIGRQMWKVALVVACIFALFLIPNPLIPRRYSFMARLGESRPILGRFYFYVAATRMIAQHPILGVGYNNFGLQFWDYAAALQEDSSNRFYSYILEDLGGIRPDHVHNEYLQIAAETGLIGLATFLFLVVVFLLRMREDYRRMNHWSERLMLSGIAAAVVFLLMDSLFSFPLRLPCSGMAFWLILGIASRYVRSETLCFPAVEQSEPRLSAKVPDKSESGKRTKRTKK
jgi:O-antigen ligase